MFGAITNLFSGGQEKGYGDMMGYLQQGIEERRRAADQANQYIDPFYQAGRGEIPGYMRNYQSMLDPNRFIGNMMKDYMTSPWAQRQLSSGNDALTNAAAASGGLGGTDFARGMMEFNRGITAADQDRYLGNALNVWNSGLDRQGNMVGMGYGAGDRMGQNRMMAANGIAQDYGAMGNAALQQSRAESGGFGDILGMLGNAGMGFISGGPKGALMGALGSMPSQRQQQQQMMQQWQQQPQNRSPFVR